MEEVQKISGASNRIYFSSDWHFGHKNILKYDPARGDMFNDLDEHNEYIVTRINEIIGENDVLYFLGDLALMSKKRAAELMERINCKNIYRILGNHDPRNTRPLESILGKYFKQIVDKLVLEIEGKKILLIHYPPEGFDGVHYDPTKYDIVIHGHTHSGSGKVSGNTIDVSYNGNKLVRDLQEIIGKTYSK